MNEINFLKIGDFKFFQQLKSNMGLPNAVLTPGIIKKISDAELLITIYMTPAPPPRQTVAAKQTKHSQYITFDMYSTIVQCTHVFLYSFCT